MPPPNMGWKPEKKRPGDPGTDPGLPDLYMFLISVKNPDSEQTLSLQDRSQNFFQGGAAQDL